MTTATERKLRARAAAHRLHATHDSRELTAPGRAAFLGRFETQVDPDGVLPAEERERRATQARKAHFAEMGAKSAKVRRLKAARRAATRK